METDDSMFCALLTVIGCVICNIFVIFVIFCNLPQLYWSDCRNLRDIYLKICANKTICSQLFILWLCFLYY